MTEHFEEAACSTKKHDAGWLFCGRKGEHAFGIGT